MLSCAFFQQNGLRMELRLPVAVVIRKTIGGWGSCSRWWREAIFMVGWVITRRSRRSSNKRHTIRCVILLISPANCALISCIQIFHLRVAQGACLWGKTVVVEQLVQYCNTMLHRASWSRQLVSLLQSPANLEASSLTPPEVSDNFELVNLLALRLITTSQPTAS